MAESDLAEVVPLSVKERSTKEKAEAKAAGNPWRLPDLPPQEEQKKRYDNLTAARDTSLAALDKLEEIKAKNLRPGATYEDK